MDGLRLAKPIGKAEQTGDDRHHRGSLVVVRGQVHPTHWKRASTAGTSPGRARAVSRAAFAATLSALGLAFAVSRLAQRVTVAGTSMLPAFEPGDHLLVVPALRVHPGQVVAVVDPREPGRLLVKRVHACSGGSVDVRGDNDASSTDSRSFGPVDRAQVVGRVVYRYGPPGRTGRVPG
ncbi:MAG: nickel-type superoxide dismutase maturation protease [Acidimicrobiales bacterium]